MQKNLGIIASSVNPQQVAATVQGAIIFASSTIVLIAGHYGIVIGDGEVQTIATQAGLIVGTVYTLYGLIRKALVWAFAKWASKK